MRRNRVKPHLVRAAAHVGIASELIGKLLCPVERDGVHPFDIVAVLRRFVEHPKSQEFRVFKVIDQRRMQFFPRDDLLVVDQRFKRREAVRNVGALDRLNAAKVIVRAASGNVDSALHAVVDHAGEERRRQQFGVRPLHHFAAADHAFKEEVYLRFEGIQHILVGFKVLQRARMRAHLLAGQRADAVVEGELQRFDKVEHGRVAPAQVVAHGGEFHAADDGVVARVLVRNALALERRNDRFVVEELRHAAAFADDLRAAGQKVLAGAFKHARRKVRLWQQQVLLRSEEEERQLVFRAAAALVLPADGNVEADREARKVLCAARAAQIDNLVELEEQALRNLQRVFQ
ncbi:hypothetical protein SDC9_138183 [bioreactor metagenome]|uniref:Uncharacterized protein n=1 Tax=bioreactor metagenome TaxID=1076179 RepID=A0A645DPL6_9ZZZZ